MLEQQLRSSIDLQNQLKLSHAKLEALGQQLASLPAQATCQATSQAAPREASQATLAVTDAPVQSGSQTAHAKGKKPPRANGVSTAKTALGAGGRSSKATAALMEDLFGSDDEEDGGDSVQGSKMSPARAVASDASASDSHRAQATSRLTQGASMGPVASAASTDRQTSAQAVKVDSKQPGSRPGVNENPSASSSLGTAQNPSLPSSSLGAAQNPSLLSSSSGQRIVDPAAPRRSISFSSNAARRRQPSSSAIAKHRRDAFDAAADAAITEALAQRAAAATPADSSASVQQAELSQPPADSSIAQSSAAHNSAAQASDAQASGSQSLASDSSKAAANSAAQVLAGDQPGSEAPIKASLSSQNSKPEREKQMTGQQHGNTATLTPLTGSAQLGHTSPSSGLPLKVAESEEERLAEEAPIVITRPSQAEKAPKLKLGSRLAASMAKLAATKPAGNVKSEVPSPAAAVPVVTQEQRKKSAIPDDVKRALLAKVKHNCHNKTSCFGAVSCSLKSSNDFTSSLGPFKTM